MPTSESVTQTEVPGGWTYQQFKIAGHTFDLVLPADPDAFLDALEKMPVSEHDKHDVYWAMLWQAAPTMAQRILQHNWPTNSDALEFGCGLGLVGLAALAAGMQVTFSDYERVAVETAVENAQRNGFAQARGEVIDWRSPPAKRYPVLLGCDVLYNQQMHEPLVDFLDSTLADDGLCWIGDAGRFHAGKFLALAAARGFKTRLEDEKGVILSEPRHGKFQMFVFSRV